MNHALKILHLDIRPDIVDVVNGVMNQITQQGAHDNTA